MLQRQAQQQQQCIEGLLNGSANRLVGNDPLLQQNPGIVNAIATKMYDERLKLPHLRDSMDDGSLKVFD